MSKQPEQRTPEWFAQRRGRVTASKVGAILGVNPWATPADVMRRMVRDHHGAPSEFEGNSATAWGVANEDGAVIDYEMDTGLDVVPAHFVEYEQWLGASPDGYVGQGGLIEVKCPYGKRDATDPSEFKSILDQPHYYAQIQVQLFCTGRMWCDFYQWAPRAQRLERVGLDMAWLADALPKLRAFWDDFQKEIDNPAHLEPLRKTVTTADASKIVADYLHAKAMADEYSDRAKGLLAALVELTGETDAEIDGHKLTRVVRKGSVSYAKALKALAPDADLEPYRGKASEYWRLS